MTRDRADAPTAERGFVIVAVLWIIMALSALAVIFSLYLSASAQALALNDTALQTEALVSASLELTAYQLTLAGDKARPSRGSFHFRMDDADVLVTFSSEAARIDLNFAPKEVLAGLFAGLGATRAAATEDADRIIGWRTRPVPGSTNDEEALYRLANSACGSNGVACANCTNAGSTCGTRQNCWRHGRCSNRRMSGTPRIASRRRSTSSGRTPATRRIRSA